MEFNSSRKIFNGKVKYIKLINKCGNCVVYMGEDVVNKKKVAVKMLACPSYSDLQRVHHEINIRNVMDNVPHVVRYYGHKYERTKGRYNVYMEYMNHGNMYDNLDMIYEDTTLNLIRKCIRHVTIALRYIHDRGYVHNDVKLENIMMHVWGDERDECIFKLIDFDRSFPMGEELNGAGTLDYRPPEQSHAVLSGLFTPAVDMWALGCVLYELYTGYLPFYHPDDGKNMRLICEGKYNKKRLDREDVRDLVEKLLVVDPDKRLTAVQVLSHPFLTKK